MRITEQSWTEYVARLARLNKRAGEEMAAYIDSHGTADTEDLIGYAYALVQKYGEGSAELACQMYDAIAQASGLALPPAEPAGPAGYDEIAQMVYGTLYSPPLLRGGVNRMVKQAGADTTLKNAIRDGAEWAWVPRGDTCAFCTTLASRGWQRAGKKILKNGHAVHIHANCDCEFAVRFDGKSGVAGYDPEKYLAQYRAAGGDINAMRRASYAENRERINAQKRAAYAARKDVNALQKSRYDGNLYKEDFWVPVGVGAKAKTVYVKMPDGSFAELTPGTRVTQVRTIAGNGRDRQIDIVDLLVDKYPGTSPEKWEKQKGMGYVDFEGESCLVELHWYYEPTVGRVKWKVKPDQGGNWFYDEDE